MKWIGRRASGNFEDRRGMATGGGVIGIIGLIIYYLLSGDSSQLQSQINAGNQAPMSAEQQQAEDSLALFSRVVLADCEDVWSEIFSEKGMNYREPVMVLFSGGTQSGCGSATSATGPFYCPAD